MRNTVYTCINYYSAHVLDRCVLVHAGIQIFFNGVGGGGRGGYEEFFWEFWCVNVKKKNEISREGGSAPLSRSARAVHPNLSKNIAFLSKFSDDFIIAVDSGILIVYDYQLTIMYKGVYFLIVPNINFPKKTHLRFNIIRMYKE